MWFRARGRREGKTAGKGEKELLSYRCKVPCQLSGRACIVQATSESVHRDTRDGQDSNAETDLGDQQRPEDAFAKFEMIHCKCLRGTRAAVR